MSWLQRLLLLLLLTNLLNDDYVAYSFNLQFISCNKFIWRINAMISLHAYGQQ